ncbi:RHS repeat-associated core domain-containing protein, partial [Amycolatopsis anabasis]|uniref:RHS repeat-associated core domain-containing protein n=1 Tax=Amycolatopsis anabasis TaxID=1840409 RepID=UPI00131E9196
AAKAGKKIDGPDVNAPKGDTTPSGTHSPDGSTTPSGTKTDTPDTKPDGTKSPDGTSPGSADTPGTSKSPDGTSSGKGTDGSLRKDAENPRDRAQEPKQRCEGREPIDLATGEMYMLQTDVRLDAALPLLLQRTHVSSYRAGRSFGPSWSSTLDQRLEIDEQGVCFAGADGVILVYPSPQTGGPEVLPAEGARWPLGRLADGSYLIRQPDRGRTLHFGPGSAGQFVPLREIRDANGNHITLEHTDDGLVSAIRHSGGYHLDTASASGRITSVSLRNPDGADIVLVRYEYDEARRLAAVVNSSGAAMRFTYDAAGRVVRWEDRNGEWYGYHYDPDGRCVRADGSGNALAGTVEYDLDARVTTETDSLGHVTKHYFNEHNQIVLERDPMGGETRFEWDRYDRLVAQTDAVGRTTRFLYNESGLPVAITRPDGAQTLTEYDEAGQPVVVIDPDGAVWRYGYDERGNLVSTTDPAGATTTTTYDERGRRSSVVDPLGNVYRIEANDAGLTVSVVDPLGATTRYDRDQFGRVSAITDPVGGVTRLQWTVEGKLLSRTRPDGSTESWRYDGEGNEIEHVDPAGGVTRLERTHFDLVSARTNADGARTEFAYDSELRPISVTNPQGLVWRYEYDANGNLVRETDFNGRTLSYVRDAAGQLLERVDGTGARTTFHRDVLGSLLERRTPEGASTRFEYDRVGRILRAVNDDAEVVFERDPLGRVLAETVNGRTVRSTYDRLGRRIRRITATGVESLWEYNAASRPVTLRTAGRQMHFRFDEAGREVERLLDTGAILAQSWDVNHRLTAQTLSTVAGSGARQARVVNRRTYRYRPDDNLAVLSDLLGGEERFETDPVGRVTAVDGTRTRERYSYDKSGNITAGLWGEGEPDLQGVREYSGTLIRSAGSVRYGHDAQGRVVVRSRKRLSAKPDTWHYEWNADDRLVGVVTPNGTRWRYTYDALGRRTSKQRLSAQDGSVEERVDFVWDGGVLAEQIESSGRNITWDWEPSNTRPLTQTCRRIGRDTPQSAIDEAFYSIVTDVIGTPKELIDPAGEVAWRANTTLWGRSRDEGAESALMPLRFPGHYFDPETGMNYNYHRYYDATTGRYVSNDPLGLRPALNPHAYVQNPTGWTDQFGLTPAPGGGHDDGHQTTTPTDLHMFGGSPDGPSPGPRPAREKDFNMTEDGTIIPGTGRTIPNEDMPAGASSFSDISNAPLTGHHYRIPAGTQLPEGLAVVADGRDVVQGSPRAATHHTIYATRPMTRDEFNAKLAEIETQHAGNIPKKRR